MPLAVHETASKYWQLYTNSKRLFWDPAAIDLTADRAQWRVIEAEHQADHQAEQVQRLCALFYQGEESVTKTLAPLLVAVPRLGLGLDQEMFLTSQLYEEAKHFEFFQRYVTEVFGLDGAYTADHMTPEPQAVLVDDLETVTARLLVEREPAALRAAFAEAVTHYMGVVEAMLARTGYVGAHDALATRGWLPGLQEGFRLIRRDEGRHVAYGMHVIHQLCAAHPELRPAVAATFERQLPNVLGTVASFAYEHPLVDVDKLANYALTQYQRFASAAGLEGAESDPMLWVDDED